MRFGRSWDVPDAGSQTAMRRVLENPPGNSRGVPRTLPLRRGWVAIDYLRPCTQICFFYRM